MNQLKMFYNGVVQNGADAHIQFDADQTLTLESTDAASITDDHVQFELQAINGQTGSDSNDIIVGTDGDDRIIDGRGLDILTGGNGADAFVITKNDDNPDIDTITDFRSGEDKVDLRSFGDIVSASQLRMQQVGQDTVLTFNNGQRLVLENIQKTSLSDQDFKFNVFDGVGDHDRFSGPINQAVFEDTQPDSFSSTIRYNQLNISHGLSASVGKAGVSSRSTYDLVNFDTSSNIFKQGAENIRENKEYEASRKSGKERVYYTARDTEFYGTDARSSSGKHGTKHYSGNDKLVGGWWNEYIDGGSGNDEIHGNGGHDRISAGSGNDYVSGGLAMMPFMVRMGMTNCMVDQVTITCMGGMEMIIWMGAVKTTFLMEAMAMIN